MSAGLILCCARCGAYGSIELFTDDVYARRAIAVASALPAEVGPLAVRYLSLFAPAKSLASWRRALKVLEELQTAIRLASIRRHGRDWPLTTAMWVEGLEQMLGKRADLRLPLKGHGYLFEILSALADKSEGAAERAAEQAIRGQARGAEAPGLDVPDAAATLSRNQVVAAAIQGENATRQRFQQPLMTKAEELQLLRRLGLGE